MAQFVSTKYQDDDGAIHPIKLTKDVADIAGLTPPTGAVTDKISAVSTKSRKAAGLHARQITGKRTVSTPDATVSVFTTIPLLTPGQATMSQFTIGGTFTYATKTYTVTTSRDELKK